MCVDNSGNWGRGGLFDAVARLSPNAYERPSEFGDLHLGDLHLVQINDNGDPSTHPNAPQWVALAVVQSYNPRRKVPRSGISISDLDVCLAKASFTASRHSEFGLQSTCHGLIIKGVQIARNGILLNASYENTLLCLIIAGQVEALQYALSLAALTRIWRNEELSTSWNEVSVYPIPAALYLVKNLLQYYIFASVDAPGYQILKNFNIMALVGYIVSFSRKSKLSEIQWSAFLLLCAGCTTAQLNSRADERHEKWGSESGRGNKLVGARCKNNIDNILLSPSKIPGVVIPGDIFLVVASALRIEFKRAFFLIRDITSGRDLKKFLAVIQAGGVRLKDATRGAYSRSRLSPAVIPVAYLFSHIPPLELPADLSLRLLPPTVCVPLEKGVTCLGFLIK
ncbi:hypothetical protein OROHE_017163 [Orobanche hederae]